MSEIIQRYRFLSARLPSAEQRGLVVITGARQTGKTTLVRALYPEVRYINLDAPENRDALIEVPTSRWHRDVGNAVLDEAQKAPPIFEKVKYAYDEGRIRFSVLCGSSQILLLRKIRETLAGRVSIRELFPLMMAEMHSDTAEHRGELPLLDKLFSSESLDDVLGAAPSVLLAEQEAITKEAEHHLLSWGGMPALLEITPEERFHWLRDYIYTYLERDLADLARLSDLEPFKKFQRLAALRGGGLLSFSELARDAGISVDTARRYLEYLHVSYQTVLLQPYSRNLTSTVVKTPKLYWIDVGILRQLSGRRSGTTGDIYENLVIGEVYKWVRTTGKDAELYFYRTRSGLEVDLLLVTEHGVTGIEVKGCESVHPTDTSSLRAIALQLGPAWRGGIVVYRGDTIRKISEPSIWAVPSRRLFGR